MNILEYYTVLEIKYHTITYSSSRSIYEVLLTLFGKKMSEGASKSVISSISEEY